MFGYCWPLARLAPALPCPPCLKKTLSARFELFQGSKIIVNHVWFSKRSTFLKVYSLGTTRPISVKLSNSDLYLMTILFERIDNGERRFLLFYCIVQFLVKKKEYLISLYVLFISFYILS